MDRLTLRELLAPSSWEWPVATCSLLILFHQYPMMLFGGTLRLAADSVLFAVIPGVALYVGWKAREFVGIDVALGTMAYAFAAELLARLRNDIPIFRSDIWLAVGSLFVIGVLAYAFALASRLWRHRQLMKSGIPV